MFWTREPCERNRRFDASSSEVQKGGDWNRDQQMFETLRFVLPLPEGYNCWLLPSAEYMRLAPTFRRIVTAGSRSRQSSKRSVTGLNLKRLEPGLEPYEGKRSCAAVRGGGLAASLPRFEWEILRLSFARPSKN